MRFQFLAVAVMMTIVAGCSDSGPKFSTRGLVVPNAQCAFDPRNAGEAERIPDIDEGNGCMVENAWRIKSIAGVRFSQPATLNCGVVGPLNDWMANVVQPAAQKDFGESVIGLDVASSYSCRPRNNRDGAKMSEHGFGNAIDISGFTLESGRKIKVEQGFWGSRGDSRFLSEVRSDACADFSTVLGPGDPYHDDHLHLDMQNRRSHSKYCK